ncbi:MAG TPA: DUF5082 family protein [Pseudogracilibacillus sp.]|nr:DUF5082 family protein [Pseudogracilibacillus sp.]
MLDLASINTYLSECDRRIGSLQMQIYEKEQDIEKLETAKTELALNKSDFLDYERICLDPEFSSDTLYGENANEIDDFREDVLKVTFLSIPKKQISKAEEAIEERIEELREDIESLQSDIEDQESIRDDYNKQKEELLSKE